VLNTKKENNKTIKQCSPFSHCFYNQLLKGLPFEQEKKKSGPITYSFSTLQENYQAIILVLH
jgi:hypothetical protein